MANNAELDCKLYLETPVQADAVAQLMAAALGGEVAHAPSAVLLALPKAEIEVRDNEDADAQAASEFPDGFLNFRHVLEVYPSAPESPEERIARTAALLELFWSQGWPAVAACPYERELPYHGGYKERSLPWPTPPRASRLVEPRARDAS